MFYRRHVLPLGVREVLERLVLHSSSQWMGKLSNSLLGWVMKVQPVRDGASINHLYPWHRELGLCVWLTPTDLLGDMLEVLKQPGSEAALPWGA